MFQVWGMPWIPALDDDPSVMFEEFATRAEAEKWIEDWSWSDIPFYIVEK